MFTCRRLLFENPPRIIPSTLPSMKQCETLVRDRCQKIQDYRRFSSASDPRLSWCLRLRIQKSEFHQVQPPSIPTVSSFQGFYAKISANLLIKKRKSYYVIYKSQYGRRIYSSSVSSSNSKPPRASPDSSSLYRISSEVVRVSRKEVDIGHPMSR